MEYVTLAKTAKEGIPNNTDNLAASVKIDGMRGVWDGGVSRGLLATTVPYAAKSPSNIGKIATGLWSRAGNVIHAPDRFLDALPPMFLDGELDDDLGNRQELFSTLRKIIPDQRWDNVKLKAFDAPPVESFFRSRTVKLIRIDTAECFNWWGTQAKIQEGFICTETMSRWSERYKILQDNYEHTLKHVPASEAAKLFELVKEQNGEGIILRDTRMPYELTRTSSLLKIKDVHDCEATITGYYPGTRKYEGMLGSYNVIDAAGHCFKVSGMTDLERNNPQPIGSVIRVMYRGVSMYGVPQEARIG